MYGLYGLAAMWLMSELIHDTMPFESVSPISQRSLIVFFLYYFKV